MYQIFIILYLSNFAIAGLVPDENNAVILSYDYEYSGGGNYKFSYKTSNGIERNEIGQLVNIGQDNEHVAVKGYYTYINPDGQSKRTDYNAADNGYHVNLPATTEKILQIAFAAPAVSGQVLASLLGK